MPYQGFADDNIANLQCISEGGWDIVMIGDSSNGISKGIVRQGKKKI
ncbi:MAG: hypothetical protein ACE1S7_05570 [Candidatus Tisiphia sp.]